MTNTTVDGAAKVRELYLAHQMTYVTAHAQLRLFFGMGAHQADNFLAVTPDQTEAKIVSYFVNGWLSRSAAKSALRAIGIRDPEARLKAAWEG